MTKAAVVFALATASLGLVVVSSHAEWPTWVVKYPGDQRHTVAVSDQTGGAILVWTDYRNGVDADIYGQRVDEYGEPLWTPNGIPICTASADQSHPIAIADGSGGVVIVWYDNRHGADFYLYAQRIDATGAALWPADGVALNDTSSVALTPTSTPLSADVISDGAGGAIVAWRSPGLSWEVQAQRIDGTGTVLWGAAGITLTSGAVNNLEPRLVSDGQGGAIVAWSDGGPDFPNFHATAQRLDPNGTPLWPAPGVSLTSNTFGQAEVAITTDGENGAIVAWTDFRNTIYTDQDIYVQRVDVSGTTRWDSAGVLVCEAAGWQGNLAMAPFGAGGAFVVYDTGPNRTEIFYNVVDSLGLTYPSPGAQITNCSGNERAFAPSGPDHFLLMYDCGSNDFTVARMGEFGYEWEKSFYGAISPADPAVVAGPAAAMVAISDSLWGSADVYGQRFEILTGYSGHPEPAIATIYDVPDDTGGQVVVEWNASGYDTGPSYLTHYSVWIATNAPALLAPAHGPLVTVGDVGPEFEGPAYRLQVLGAQTYYWEWVANQDALKFEGYSITADTRYDSTASDPGWHYFQVVAHTSDPNLFWPSQPDSGYSVDDPPGAPAAFAVEYNTGSGNHLTWDPSSEKDLWLYRVYRSTDPGFVPTPGSEVHATPNTEWNDPDYDGWNVVYKITAVDSAGNESGPATADQVTGIDDPSKPRARFALEAGVPNPFNPSTTIHYSVDVDGPVSLKVYDVAGRLVAVLVEGFKARGGYTAVWNGKDLNGQPVASGVYVNCLRSGGRLLSNKVVLLK